MEKVELLRECCPELQHMEAARTKLEKTSVVESKQKLQLMKRRKSSKETTKSHAYPESTQPQTMNKLSH